MHDTIELEVRGIPSVFIATVEFTDGAQVQARALGADPAAVYVRHPIQDRTDDEMRSIANEAFKEVVAALEESPAS